MLRRIREFADRHFVGIIVMLLAFLPALFRVWQGEYAKAGTYIFIGLLFAGFLRFVRRASKLNTETSHYSAADFDAVKSPRFKQADRLRANR